MQLKHNISKETITELEQLLSFLKSNNLTNKLKKLNSLAIVKETIEEHPFLRQILSTCNPAERYALTCFMTLGQIPILFQNIANENPSEIIQSLLKILLDLEKSYDVIGGIIGYHLEVLKLIKQKDSQHLFKPENSNFFHPPGEDLTQQTPNVLKAIRHGIANMPHTAEIYPVGGAGDRLDLHDETTGEALPSAELAFNGITLLESLIRDLQAREYLHYKLHGKQVITPIAMMTSHEKNNNSHIKTICTKNKWFGRPKNSIDLFVQPLVPMIAIDGNWVTTTPGHLMLKPGGHGVIWKLALEAGIIDKLLKNDFKYALIRQINNPIAGTDSGLSAFIGLGIQQKKFFGFASCPRLLNASEGMDVLIETHVPNGVDYRISNIEYTDFEQKGIEDVPAVTGSPYSKYPANTNILFLNLLHLKKLVEQSPIPGMLVNMKTMIHRPNEPTAIPAGRLESTMQNISDYIVDHYAKPSKQINFTELKTFVIYNERKKTISVTKKSYVANGPLSETPEGCFYEQLQNQYDLLKEHCHFQIPTIPPEEIYIKEGPSFVFYFHPALGPFYDVISQKIQRGTLEPGSELRLMITELEMNDLHLQGSLLIEATSPLGSLNNDQIIQYNENSGKCILRNVSVINKGINRDATNIFWKNRISHHESLKIVIEGNGEFFAENVVLSGDQEIIVPDGYKITVDMHQGKLRYQKEKIDKPTWSWKYTFDVNDRIVLSLADR